MIELYPSGHLSFFLVPLLSIQCLHQTVKGFDLRLHPAISPLNLHPTHTLLAWPDHAPPVTLNHPVTEPGHRQVSLL